jgi:S1-C subfamily serine protease
MDDPPAKIRITRQELNKGTPPPRLSAAVSPAMLRAAPRRSYQAKAVTLLVVPLALAGLGVLGASIWWPSPGQPAETSGDDLPAARSNSKDGWAEPDPPPDSPAGADETWVEQIARSARHSIVRIETPRGHGTGFVIAGRGRQHLLLTNKHVLARGPGLSISRGDAFERCRVVLGNGESVPGQLAGLMKDPAVDLALVHVASAELRPLGALGAYDQVRVGERVVAIGHPLGLDYTVTDGIVSARRGGLLIQTTAAINPGSSGGPLINRAGRIIGVNTLVVDPTRGQALGFAVRADLARDRDRWTFTLDVADLIEALPK